MNVHGSKIDVAKMQYEAWMCMGKSTTAEQQDVLCRNVWWTQVDWWVSCNLDSSFLSWDVDALAEFATSLFVRCAMQSAEEVSNKKDTQKKWPASKELPDYNMEPRLIPLVLVPNYKLIFVDFQEENI